MRTPISTQAPTPTPGMVPYLIMELRRGFEVIKTFFMLNSAELEILNAHNYENIRKNQISSGSDKPIMLFFLLIYVKMPTIVGKLLAFKHL